MAAYLGGAARVNAVAVSCPCIVAHDHSFIAERHDRLSTPLASLSSAGAHGSQVGRVNASAIDADTLEENGIQAPPSAAGCAHQLVLKPYGEQSDPDDPFPVLEGTAGCLAAMNHLTPLLLLHLRQLARSHRLAVHSRWRRPLGRAAVGRALVVCSVCALPWPVALSTAGAVLAVVWLTLCRLCIAGNATTKAVQAFVHGGFPEAAVAPLNAASIPTFMAADGGTAPRVTADCPARLRSADAESQGSSISGQCGVGWVEVVATPCDMSMFCELSNALRCAWQVLLLQLFLLLTSKDEVSRSGRACHLCID
jgi:hypothetical protein